MKHITHMPHLSTKEAKRQAFADMKKAKLITHALFSWYKEEIKYKKENTYDYSIYCN